MTALAQEAAGVVPGTARPAPRAPLMADPMPIAFALFAFALASYFVRFVDVGPATLSAGPETIGLDYAVLAGAIAEVLAGILGIIRGMGYPAYVVSTFGIWLLGFYLLITSGADNKEFTPNALACFCLLLIVPVAILAVPSFAPAHRNIPFAVAFIALIGLLLFLGLGFHYVYDQVTTTEAAKTPPKLDTAVDLVKVSAWCGLVAAVAIWTVFAKEVYGATGLLRKRTS
jgi:succinate-acetate transporter protein